MTTNFSPEERAKAAADLFDRVMESLVYPSDMGMSSEERMAFRKAMWIKGLETGPDYFMAPFVLDLQCIINRQAAELAKINS